MKIQDERPTYARRWPLGDEAADRYVRTVGFLSGDGKVLDPADRKRLAVASDGVGPLAGDSEGQVMDGLLVEKVFVVEGHIFRMQSVFDAQMEGVRLVIDLSHHSGV